MSKFLANENVPRRGVYAARTSGLDVAWICEDAPGSSDDEVLSLSVSDNRVLVTFDKDFGEMAFRQGKNATSGIILLRPRVQTSAYLSQFMVDVLSRNLTWEGSFSVAQAGRIRSVPLG